MREKIRIRTFLKFVQKRLTIVCPFFTYTICPLDHIDSLVDLSLKNLREDGKGSLLETGQLVMVTGDGRKGYAAEAPYDAIHVGAAAPTLPQDLGQLLLQ